MFNKHPRYDFVIITTRLQRLAFARLVFIFVCQVNGHNHQLALIQPLEKKSRPNANSVDRSLSIYRWHLRDRSRCEVIEVGCIVRGAVLVEDTKYSGDYFVIDTLDEDMFLRVRGM